METMPPPERPPLDLKRRGREPSASLLGELWQFLRLTGKWWLVPVLVALLLLGAAVWLSGSGAAPFLYTLF
jgi:hypothetical protein